MSRDRPPPPDLARIVGAPAAHVVAAVPLEPAARILRMDPALPAPRRQATARRSRRSRLRRASWRSAQSFARANQLAGNSRRQSVMYLPPNTPSCSICFGVSWGRNSGAKFRPIGSRAVIDVPALHLVVDDDLLSHGGSLRLPGSMARLRQAFDAFDFSVPHHCHVVPSQ